MQSGRCKSVENMQIANGLPVSVHVSIARLSTEGLSIVKATHGSDEVSASAPATVARSVKTPAALSATGALLARLHQVGAECELHGSRRQPTAGGVCITVEVLDALRSPMVTMRLANTLLLLLQDDIPVTLGLRGLGSPGKAERILRDFCTLLAGVLDDGGVVYAAPGLCVFPQGK